MKNNGGLVQWQSDNSRKQKKTIRREKTGHYQPKLSCFQKSRYINQK